MSISTSETVNPRGRTPRVPKHATLFERKPSEAEADGVLFWQSVDEGEDRHALVLTSDTWAELGKPDTITVTVQPGDHLNQPAPDNASDR